MKVDEVDILTRKRFMIMPFSNLNINRINLINLLSTSSTFINLNNTSNLFTLHA